MSDSERKVAIVTGSATGVGASAAILLAEKGCNVVINYTRSKDEAEATAATCREKGAEAITVQADVSEDADCRRMVQAAVDKWGRIDYLINNAARTKFNPYPQMDGVTKDDFLNIYAVNVVGAYQMIRAVEPHIRKTRGAIVNDSSIGGVTGIASSIPYAASKAALNLMTKSLAHVLAPEVRINTVVPGMIQTRWLQGNMSDDAYEQLISSTAENLPLKQVATAEDIAETLIFFLMGPGSRLVTGETLIADAGIHLGPFPPYASGKAE
ncbi:MAG: SDR family oxidoreductase [Gammaproteobacteria bacterium]|nr:SDR family oxidoreductase [Gammaproteobacteria bacterium]